MKGHSEEHYRRSIRLRGYDYSQMGAYFVTICTRDKKCLFGRIVDGKMVLNRFGEVARDEWNETANIRRNVELDEYVIMPNHLHGIIVISDSRGGTRPRASTVESFGKPIPSSLPTIVRGYKAAVTRRIGDLQKTRKRTPVWQRNYYEHIIRNEEDLRKAREYIINNPLKWELDKENPANLERNI